MANWSDNIEAFARAVTVKRLEHDGISEEQLAAHVDMWWHLTAAELECGVIDETGEYVANRLKRKDAYDIYYSVRNFPDGTDAFIEVTQPLLDTELALQGYSSISNKFRNAEDFGPASVKRFVAGSQLLGDPTPDQWQPDAFGQVYSCL